MGFSDSDDSNSSIDGNLKDLSSLSDDNTKRRRHKTNLSTLSGQSPKLKRGNKELRIKVSEKENSYRNSRYPDIENVLQENIVCSVCGNDLAPDVEKGSEVNFHPHLRVLLCKKCRMVYNEGDFSSDEDGSDQYCRWCANGGSLYCCSKCVCAFCKKCIKRNVSKDFLKALDDDDDWECFICKPEPLYECRALCYAAVECSRNRKKLLCDIRKQKVNALVLKRRAGTKRKRLNYSKKSHSDNSDSSDSDLKVIEDNAFNSLASKKTNKLSTTKADSLGKKSISQKALKESSDTKLPKSRTLKGVKKSQSSEDFSDSDFEPKHSQRFKCIGDKKKRKSTESKDETLRKGMLKVHDDATVLNSQKGEVSPLMSTLKSKSHMVLDSLADDMDCISKMLVQRMCSVRQKYLSDPVCNSDMLSVATAEMLRLVKVSVQNLNNLGTSLESFQKEIPSGSGMSSINSSSGNKEKHSQVKKEKGSDSLPSSETDQTAVEDHIDSQKGLTPPESSSDVYNKSTFDSTAKRCGSTTSEGCDDVASPRAPSHHGNTSDEEVVGKVNETPQIDDLGLEETEAPQNGSFDMFDDIQEMMSETEDVDGDHGTSSGCKSASKSTAPQSHKSLESKQKLMASSSSDSEVDNVENNTKQSSKSTSSINKTEKNSDSDSEVKSPRARSSRSKQYFDVKSLDIYHSDTKLQYKCAVTLETMNEIEERRLLELVGDYYDADSSDSSDGERSVDNLTNLGNLKRRIKSVEDDAKEIPAGKSNNGKQSKKDLKDEKKLADFLGNSSEVESSFEKSQRLSNVDDERPLENLNDARKKILLQSSESETEAANDNNEDNDKESSEDEKKLIPKKEKEDEPEESNGDKKVNKESEGENESKVKKKDWRKNKLLTGKLSDSDTSDDMRKISRMKPIDKHTDASSDENPTPLKKRKSQSASKDVDSDVVEGSDDPSSSTSEDFVKKKPKILRKKSSSSSSSESDSKKKPQKKRKRIKVAHSSSSSDEDKTAKDAESPAKGRKKIRHVIREDDLEEGTKNAAKEEEERLKRISDRQKVYDEIYENIQKGFETLEKLILDFDEKTKEPLVEVDEVLVKKLKPHQAKGVKFMWDACFESLKRMKSSKGSGCILAHCMGLGKTFQVVTLVHTLFKYPATKVHRVLVVCPVSTVLNWVNEFHKWLKDVKDGCNLEVFELTRCKQNIERSYRLKEWLEDGGVMVMGYDMYRNLSNPETKRYRASIMKSFQSSLVDPGPDLVICDEGHLLKNEDTALSKAMSRIKTLRRIVLTGTPLQNNLKEYHCMVQFVKPNLLGTRKEFLNRFVNPITNGQFEDSTAHDVKRMKRRAHVLHKTLEGSVQRFDYSVLTPFLPSKQEYVISVRLTELQEKLYKHYLDNFSSRGAQGKGAQLFADFQQLQRIWTHPRVLKMSAERNELKAEKEEEDDSEGSLRDFIDDDDDNSDDTSSSSKSSSDSEVVCISGESEDEKKSTKAAKKPGRRTRSNKDIPSEPEPIESKKEAEWWQTYVQDSDFEDLRGSPKLSLLFSILKSCEDNGEKLLVFSQSLFSLDVIEYFLSKIDDATQRGVFDETLDNHQGSWSPGIDYFRLDGSTPADTRSSWCNLFNKPSNLKGRLFLISTRAGGLGINLVAANRVIIFDASWNPSHDVQSIFRVYRFGQKKPCFIYRFLAQGTMEEKIYERQVTKLSLACRVVDELQIERYYKMADLAELYNFTPADRSVHIMPKLPKDHMFAEILKSHDSLIVTYHEHDSLLENKEAEELNEDERQAAWEDYENEKKGSVNQGTASGVLEPLPTLEQVIEVLRQKLPNTTDVELTAMAQRTLQQAYAQQQQLRQQQQYALQQRLMAQQQHLMQQQMQQRMMYALQQQQQQQQPGWNQSVNFPNAYPNGRFPMQNTNFPLSRNLNSQVSITPTLPTAAGSSKGPQVIRPPSTLKPSFFNPYSSKKT